jgi:hypothetical protein
MVSPPFLIRADGPTLVRFKSGGLSGTTTMLIFHFCYSYREHAMSKISFSLVSLDLFRRYLKLNPRETKSGDKEEYVSLNLELAQPCFKSSMVVEATFKFLLYDQLYAKHHEQNQGTLSNYS